MDQGGHRCSHTTLSSRNDAFTLLPSIVCICNVLFLASSSTSSSMTYVVVAFSSKATTTKRTTSGGRPPIVQYHLKFVFKTTSCALRSILIDLESILGALGTNVVRTSVCNNLVWPSTLFSPHLSVPSCMPHFSTLFCLLDRPKKHPPFTLKQQKEDL